MNTGQTLFALGALALLSTSVVTVYKAYNTTYQAIIQAKLGITATSLASSFVEEASGKAFDKNTDSSTATMTSQLTPYSQLGKETGEFWHAAGDNNFNDFDDYNNFDTTQTFQDVVFSKPYGGGSFRVKCKVEYVNAGNPNVAVLTQTWHKKLTVTVTSPDMKDTVRTQYIFSYWYY